MSVAISLEAGSQTGRPAHLPVNHQSSLHSHSCSTLLIFAKPLEKSRAEKRRGTVVAHLSSHLISSARVLLVDTPDADGVPE